MTETMTEVIIKRGKYDKNSLEKVVFLEKIIVIIIIAAIAS